MRVGLLITSVGGFGQSGFYNSQEIGLARELGLVLDEVIIYKAVDSSEVYVKEKIEGCHNVTLMRFPVKSLGTNGVWDCSVMDSTLDALIYFADTQLAIPKVYRWCRQNQVKMYPYIGVIESHSTNIIKKLIINGLFYRNVKVYQKCICFVKTPYIEEMLRQRNVQKMKLAPVGLDITLLRKDYAAYLVATLKERWGYSSEEKVLLFIGRMTEEKRPMEMLSLFQKIYQKNKNYRLFMIGKGELLGQVQKEAEKLGNVVRFVEQIPNQNIWELYRIADCFVNLNKQEIFGMAILEAMYYGCKVVAWKAPGPSYIIENGVSGCLADDEEQLLYAIEKSNLDEQVIHHRIMECFLWNYTAKMMYEQIRKDNATEQKN